MINDKYLYLFNKLKNLGYSSKFSKIISENIIPEHYNSLTYAIERNDNSIIKSITEQYDDNKKKYNFFMSLNEDKESYFIKVKTNDNNIQYKIMNELDKNNISYLLNDNGKMNIKCANYNDYKIIKEILSDYNNIEYDIISLDIFNETKTKNPVAKGMIKKTGNGVHEDKRKKKDKFSRESKHKDKKELNETILGMTNIESLDTTRLKQLAGIKDVVDDNNSLEICELIDLLTDKVKCAKISDIATIKQKLCNLFFLIDGNMSP